MVNFVALASEEIGVSFIILIDPRHLKMAVKCECSAHTNKLFFFSSSKHREEKSKWERILRLMEQNDAHVFNVM